MTEPVIFTKKAALSRTGYLVWIPKDVVDFLKITKDNVVEMGVRKLGSKFEPITFTKRIAKSGRGYLTWMPKDVSDFLRIDNKSTLEIKIRKLVRPNE